MKKGIILVSIICIILSGCGNKKDVSDDFSNVQGSMTTVEQASEGEAVIEKVNYSIDGKISGSSLVVDAEVDTRIPDGIQVYNVKEINVTDEYLLSMASNVFDQEKYEIVLPEDSYSPAEQKSMLDEMDSELERIAEESGKVYVASEKYNRIASYLESDMSNVNYDLAEGQVIVQTKIWIQDMQGAIYEYDIETGLLQGKINGKLYEMRYYNGENDQPVLGYMNSNSLSIYPVEGKPFKTRYVEIASMDDSAVTDNGCNYQEAFVSAQDLIQNLGLINYELACVYAMFEDEDVKGVLNQPSTSVSGMGAKEIPNGYRFAFTPNMDGMGVGYYHDTSNTTTQYFDLMRGTPELKDELITQPSVIVDVDDTGIIDVYAEGLAEVTDSIANNVNVVAFSQADANAQKEFIDNFEGHFQVSDIRLEYVVVKYDKETVMVPGWVYYRNNFGGLNYTVLAINALDGSPIFYSYNFYHTAR